MQFLKAASMAPSAQDWLANTHQPRILHVFDHVCNLINEHREVLSVVTEQIGNGPFNLVIEDEVCFSEQLNAESSISISASQIALGGLMVNIGHAKFWSPRPDWETLHAKHSDISNQLVTLQITDYQPLLPYSLLSTLSYALANADISSARVIASQLAGLGNGLTPAGDDFLLGAIYAAWILHPAETASILTREISNTAAPLTTSLSAAWLRAGGRGEAGAVWQEFFKALLMTDSATIQLQMAKLISIGHTSGADALTGFMITLAAASPFLSS